MDYWMNYTMMLQETSKLIYIYIYLLALNILPSIKYVLIINQMRNKETVSDQDIKLICDNLTEMLGKKKVGMDHHIWHTSHSFKT